MSQCLAVPKEKRLDLVKGHWRRHKGKNRMVSPLIQWIYDYVYSSNSVFTIRISESCLNQEELSKINFLIYEMKNGTGSGCMYIFYNDHNSQH